MATNRPLFIRCSMFDVRCFSSSAWGIHPVLSERGASIEEGTNTVCVLTHQNHQLQAVVARVCRALEFAKGERSGVSRIDATL
jgi:hypothetical protein